jgi:hypothetical protein
VVKSGKKWGIPLREINEMVINELCGNTIDEEIFSFLKENSFIGLRLRLILFWGRHPMASFNLDGIAYVMEITRHHLKELLKDLIDKGLINEQYCTSGIAYYSLNHEHEYSGHIKRLAEMDWSEINSIEGELEREALSV